MDAAGPGDTVMVMPGTYAGVSIGAEKLGLKLKASGPPGSVKIVGAGGGIAIGLSTANAGVEGFDISGFGRGIVAGGQAQDTQTQITGNTIHDCSSICVELRGAGNYEVDHNTLVGGVAGILLQPPGPNAAANPQHHLHHNRVTGTQGAGIGLYGAPGSTLDHNVCDNNGGDGIYLAGSPNCTADHNQTDNNGWAGIEVGGSPDCVVTGNEANNNAGWGIYVWNSSGSSFERNVCDNNAPYGIFLSDSPNCRVDNNQADNNDSYGIWVATSCGSTFERNVAKGNGGCDLFAPPWGDPACNTYLSNQAVTAYPSPALWDVK